MAFLLLFIACGYTLIEHTVRLIEVILTLETDEQIDLSRIFNIFAVSFRYRKQNNCIMQPEVIRHTMISGNVII